MGKAALVQSAFTGGEWSPFAQGRVDLPHYKMAMATCLNGIPLEAGAWTRRSGTTHVTYTRRGKVARLYRYRFSWKDNDVIIEVSFDGSNSWLRFYDGPELLTDVLSANYATGNAGQPIVGVSGTAPANINVTAHGWSTGDDVVFYMPQTNFANNGSILLGRVFTITKVDADNFTIADACGGATFAATAINFDSTVTNTVARVTKIALPYTSAADLTDLRIVVGGTVGSSLGLYGGAVLLLLSPRYWPFAVAATEVPQSPGFPVFTSNTYAAFTDGPYINTAVGTLTASAATGSVTLTAGTPYPRQTGGWVTNDATHGSPVRIYSEPAQWASGTAYNMGDTVTVGVYPASTFYAALVANTGNTPDSSPNIWVPVADLGQWTWATITAVTNGHTVTATIEGPDIAYYTNIVAWLEGLWSTQWGYPSCGVFASGRLWFSEAYFNGKFDATVSDDFYNFAPTDNFGVLADSNGISYQITAPGVSPIYWMCEDARGILIGMKNCESLLSAASSTDGNITPTDIKDKKYSSLGSTPNAEPSRLGLAIAFIQNSGKQVIEYIADTFSQKFGGRALDKWATHLTAPGVLRVDQQNSKTPIIWALDTLGNLLGCTYRRVSNFASEEPEVYGWHRHTLGTAWTVKDLTAGLCANTTDETVYLCNFDGDRYHVEYLQPLTDENRTNFDGWFLDACPGSWTGGTSTSIRQLSGTDPALHSGSAGIYIQGLYHLTGKVVSCMIAGLNMGTYTVDASGGITVPYASDPGGLGTALYFQGLSGSASTMHSAGANLDLKISGSQARVVVPVVVGMPYTSEGQLVRPEGPGGPGVHIPVHGETRRLHMFAANLINTTTDAQFGTNFTAMYPADLRTAGLKALANGTGFTGIYWNNLNDDFTFNGQLCWKNSSPFAMTVGSVSFFLEAAER